MLFLYRPQETWMPFSLPRNRTDQAAYNRELQRDFSSTRRVAPPDPAPNTTGQSATLNDLEALRESGALTQSEFDAIMARISK